MLWDIPPAVYDHAPTVAIIEWRMTAGQIAVMCRGEDVAACAYVDFAPGVCVINLPIVGPGGVSPRTYAILRRHEISHCNGWRHPR